MAIDLTRLQADFAKALPLLQAVPDLKAQLADVQAKLAAAPHEDPSVQAAIDKMATDLEAAMPSDGGELAPLDGEPTSTTPPADSTAEPAPVTTAPAETAPTTQTDAIKPL